MPCFRPHQLLIATPRRCPPATLFAAAEHKRAEVPHEDRELVARSAPVAHEHAREVFETAELAPARE